MVPVLEQVVLRPMLAAAVGAAGRAAARARRGRAGATAGSSTCSPTSCTAGSTEHEDVVTALVARPRARRGRRRGVDERVAQRTYPRPCAGPATSGATRGTGSRVAIDDALLEPRQGPAVGPRDPGARARAPAARCSRTTASARRSRRCGWPSGPCSRRRPATRAATCAAGWWRGSSSFGTRLAADPALQASVDRYAQDAAGYLVTSYRDEVATVISETIERWDGARGEPRGSSCTWAATCSSSASTARSWAAWWAC